MKPIDIITAAIPRSDPKVQRDYAEGVIKALTAAGYAITPVEPTDEMFNAGWDIQINNSGDATVIYKAMLAARPGVE